MSQETLDYHWGKHHKTYVENLNKQIVGTDLDGLSLEEVVLLSYNRGNMLPAFNNVAQVLGVDLHPPSRPIKTINYTHFVRKP